MKVYQSIQEFKQVKHAVVTIGTFDGVHTGHQKIISRLREIANMDGGETVVLTFFPHPRMVLQPDDNDLKLITTLDERIELLEHFGIQHLIVQPFDKEFSRITAVEFVRDILATRIGTKTLVIGHDHHFGRNREGSYKDLEELAPLYGFYLEEIPVQVVNELEVSSTKIRNALLGGDMRAASELLGYDFSLNGKVVEGDKIGKTLGYPTANISVAEKYKLIPAAGIYAARVNVGSGSYNGMLYIGTRPTLNGRKTVIEVNIFDFEKNIYDQPISVSLKDKIRDDERFENLELLKQKLAEDKISATKILS